MSQIGYVRLSAPKMAKVGEIVRARVLVTHPMQGIERDKNGVVLKKNYHFINKVTAYFNDFEIANILPTQSVSENPFFSFGFRVPGPGVMKVIFEDTLGGKFQATRDIGIYTE